MSKSERAESSPANSPSDADAHRIVGLSLAGLRQAVLTDEDAFHYMAEGWMLSRRLNHPDGEYENITVIFHGPSIEEANRCILMSDSRKKVDNIILTVTNGEITRSEDAPLFQRKTDAFIRAGHASKPT